MRSNSKTIFTCFLVSTILIGQTHTIGHAADMNAPTSLESEQLQEKTTDIFQTEVFNQKEVSEETLVETTTSTEHNEPEEVKNEIHSPIGHDEPKELENETSLLSKHNEPEEIKNEIHSPIGHGEPKELENKTSLLSKHNEPREIKNETITESTMKSMEIPMGPYMITIEGKEPLITMPQIISGQISKVFENIRLNNLQGARDSFFEEYMIALKEEFGEQKEELDCEKHCPNTENLESESNSKKHLESLKELFFDIVDKSNPFKKEERREHEKEKVDQIEEETKKVELFFHSLCTSNPDIDVKNMVNRSMETLLSTLKDKHASYYSTTQERLDCVDEIHNPHKNYGGGFVFSDSKIYFCDIVKGTPNELNGIKEGDQLLAVNDTKIDETIAGDTENFANLLSSFQDCPIVFELKRGTEILKIPLGREQNLKIPLVTSEQFGPIGYIKVESFGKNASEEFQQNLTQLKNENIQGLVLDLRDNTGGSTLPCQDMLNLILNNKHAETHQFAGGHTIEAYTSSEKCENDLQIPFSIIANKNTASASEVLIGALKDQCNAKIVGQKTFGKGQGQTISPGPLHTGLKHTIYEMISPKGIHFNEVGFQPDYPASTRSAQKITALRAAGLDKFDIQIRDYAAIINQHEPISSGFCMYEQDGKTYAPVEFLVAPYLLKWTEDSEKQKVFIQTDNETLHEFNSITKVPKFKNDITRISIEEFNQVFPEMKYEKSENEFLFKY